MFTYFAPLFVFQFFLIFARIGTAFMVFPVLSDPAISVRVRLLLALSLSFLLYPLLSTHLAVLPETASQTVFLLFGELILGILMGIAARLMMAALSLAGEFIAFMAGFQSATLFDPTSGSSTAAPTLFLSLSGGLMILLLGLHHVFLAGVVQSYEAFPPGELPPVGDVLQAVLNVFQTFFEIGLQLAAPVAVAGLLSYAVFGVFNRLVPQLQVFFLSVPLSIMLSLAVLSAAMGGVLTLFGNSVQRNMFLFEQDQQDGM